MKMVLLGGGGGRQTHRFGKVIRSCLIEQIRAIGSKQPWAVGILFLEKQGGVQ